MVSVGFTGGMPASAQLAGQGAISGTITDESGAAIPNAKVVATAVSTNVQTVRTATGDGNYSISPLTPDTYTLTVTAPGFATFVQKNITVNATETAAVQPKLKVGGVGETVTVTEAPPVLDTTSATLGAVMDQQMYSSLPLMMGAGGNADQRRATDFAALMPGVQNTYAASSSSNSTDASGGVNGGNPNGGTSDIYIEGLDLPEADGIGDPRFTWTAISVDAINQFQVETVGIPAQYAGQGIQNFSVKSGGNKFHGSLYEYLRNTVLDAWPTNSKGVPTLTGQPVPTGGSCSSVALQASTSWCSLQGIKPKEIMNEFGIVLSGPIVKNKLFLFYNYGQYRYQRGPKNVIQTEPTLAMMGYSAAGQPLGYADFTGYAAALNFNLYDPATQKVQNCSGAQCTRNLLMNGTTANQIPGNRISQAAKYFNQYFLPYEGSVNQTQYSNNAIAGYASGLSNWYQTGRLDYTISPSQQLGIIVAFGRQASTGPNSGPSTTNNFGPPFNTAQAYHPVTNIDIVKHTWTITPHLINQAAIAFGRYQSISVTPDTLAQYAASNSGLLNTPAGQASFFPGISFTGNGYNPTNEAGYDQNNKVNNTYNVTDNLQWVKGAHNFTFGGQVVDVQFNYTKNLTNSSPMTYTYSSAQTAGYVNGALTSNSGSSYASYMLGAVNTSSVSVGVPTLGTRWLDPSFWAQDDWKITSKLTVNLGVRWDIFPSIHETHDIFSWLNPTGQNAISGNLGTLAFAGGNSSDGYHTGVHNPAPTYYKNIAPRIGLAFQSDPKTVWKAAYDINYARGDWTSGSQSGTPSTTGLVPAAAPTSVGSNQPQFYWDGTQCGTNGVAQDGFTACGWTGSVSAPSTQIPAGGTFANFGTAETATIKGANASTITYFDSRLGARTPEYENWSFGIEKQLTNDMSVSISYVGAAGHFISVSNAKYQTNNKLPESFAALANFNTTTAGGAATPCTPATCGTGGNLVLLNQAHATPAVIALAQAQGFTPPNGFSNPANYYSAQNYIYQYFTAFPQYSGVSDTTSFVGNTSFNALEISFRQRPAHGLNWMVNYTWAKTMDNLGTFRVYDNPKLDRSISTANQPQNLVGTVVYALPVGRGHMFGSNFVYRALVSDWTFSDIVQLHSGLPLLVTGSGCGGSNILNQCMPSIVPNQKGRQYNYGKTKTGATISWDPNSPNYLGGVQYVNPSAFTVNVATGGSGQAITVGQGSALYVPGNAPRTAPMNMYSQAYFDDDIALKRAFPIYHEWKLQFEADISNITNHVVYAPPTNTVQSGSNTSFGTITGPAGPYQPREVQLSGRISW